MCREQNGKMIRYFFNVHNETCNAEPSTHRDTAQTSFSTNLLSLQFRSGPSAKGARRSVSR